MNNWSFFAIVLGVVLVGLVIFLKGTGREAWGFASTTYVNTPTQRGVVPMQPNLLWGGNYYNRLDWQPWGYHRPGYYYRRNPVPLDAIRWSRPMLTSLDTSPKDYALGQWVYAGTAYTDNPDDFTVMSVYQLNLDPSRDLYSYAVKNKDGQVIPITLQPGHDKLDNGDRFQIPGMEGKGDFVFDEIDKYTYVYT